MKSCSKVLQLIKVANWGPQLNSTNSVLCPCVSVCVRVGDNSGHRGEGNHCCGPGA